MDKFDQIEKIKAIYAKGGNIIKYLKSLGDNKQNSIEDILISYDFQSGSYIKADAANPEFRIKYCKSLAQVIGTLGEFDSILEVGVGEATTLNALVQQLPRNPSKILGFDISWSRLKFAKELLADFQLTNTTLFAADLFQVPLQENSVDIVYTSHSIEPNGGREKEALQELYRITRKFLILLEPAYEFANDESRKRMTEHGYVTQLHATALDLGYKVIEHRQFDHASNPLNPTGLILIEKAAGEKHEPELRCPVSLTNLVTHGQSFLYSKDSLLAYPVLEGIPCLLKSNSILASHLLTNYEEFKAENNIENS